MSAPTLEQVLDWWTGDLPDEEEARVEEEIFASDDAFATAGWIAQLAHSVATAAVEGGVPTASLTHTVASQLESAGIPHTSYAAKPGDTVLCAATVDQRFSIVHLKADLEGVDRVDVTLSSPHIGQMRVNDVAVNYEDGEVALLQAGDAVRSLPTTTLTFEVRGHRSGAEVLLGTYTLHHSALGY